MSAAMVRDDRMLTEPEAQFIETCLAVLRREEAYEVALIGPSGVTPLNVDEGVLVKQLLELTRMRGWSMRLTMDRTMRE